MHYYNPRYIRITSDLHMDKQGNPVFRFEPLDTDSQTILVLAGDIDLLLNLEYKSYYFYAFMKSVAKQFMCVLWVPGNHEYRDIEYNNLKPYQDFLNRNGMWNIKIADNEIVETKNARFLCSTLWFDMNNQNPDIIKQVDSIVESENYPFNTKEIIERSSTSINFLKHSINKIDHNKTNVVVTHYPFSESLYVKNPNYNDVWSDIGYPIFGCDLDFVVQSPLIDFAVFGHTHASGVYKLKRNDGSTLVAYNNGFGHGNDDFDPNIVLNL